MASKLPQSLEAEKSILGAIFLSPKTTSRVIETMREEDFFDERHVFIFQAIKDLYNQKKSIDYTSVSSVLSNKKQLETVGNLSYLIELANYTVSLEHLNTYMAIVKDLALKRDIISVTQSLAVDGLTKDLESGDYLEIVNERILALTKRRSSGDFKPVVHIVSDIKEKIDQMKTKGGNTGLATGFDDLDHYIHGLNPGELIIIAARPSVGKSALAMNMALNIPRLASNNHASVAVFSLEMSNEQLVTRMLSNIADIDTNSIRTGQMTAQEWKQFEIFSEQLNTFNIYFDDSSTVNISEIRSKCRKYKMEGKLDAVIIDYLQLIGGESSKNTPRQEEVSRISRSLKQMAIELDIPVVALSQLSRDAEKENAAPKLAHLRESGSIEQDADIVIFIHPKSNLEQTGVKQVEIHVAKNRQGATTGEPIVMIFDGKRSRFNPVANRDEAN